MEARRVCSKYLKCRKKKSYQPRIIAKQSNHPSKMKFFEGEIKTLSDKDWEFIANRLALKITLKEVLQRGRQYTFKNHISIKKKKRSLKKKINESKIKSKKTPYSNRLTLKINSNNIWWL